MNLAMPATENHPTNSSPLARALAGTYECADDARVACPLFQGEYGGSKPTSALQLRFSTVEKSVFKNLNGKWHSRLPQIKSFYFKVCYSAEYDNIIYAVAAWSNPVARLLPQHTWLELRRFAIAPDAPRFVASRMLGWMRRDIVKRFPDVERLISYQDMETHTGTIYKASGWKHAENFKPRARGWIGWGNQPRKGRTNQAVAPRMRWELALRT